MVCRGTKASLTVENLSSRACVHHKWIKHRKRLNWHETCSVNVGLWWQTMTWLCLYCVYFLLYKLTYHDIWQRRWSFVISCCQHNCSVLVASVCVLNKCLLSACVVFVVHCFTTAYVQCLVTRIFFICDFLTYSKFRYEWSVW